MSVTTLLSVNGMEARRLRVSTMDMQPRPSRFQVQDTINWLENFGPVRVLEEAEDSIPDHTGAIVEVEIEDTWKDATLEVATAIAMTQVLEILHELPEPEVDPMEEFERRCMERLGC